MTESEADFEKPGKDDGLPPSVADPGKKKVQEPSAAAEPDPRTAVEKAAVLPDKKTVAKVQHVSANGVSSPLLTTLLVVANIIVFLFMYKENSGVLWHPSTDLLLEAGADYGPLVAGGQWWRIFTSGFVHIGVIHLLLNMGALSNIGSGLEQRVGVLKYLLIYMISLITSSLLSLYVHPYTISAGASGAIFGLLGCQLVMLLGLWRKIPKLKLVNFLLGDLIMIGLYFAIGYFFPQIDNFAHLGGLLGGIAAGLVLLPLDSASKLPNVLNCAGLTVLVLSLWQANTFVVHKAKEAAAVMTVSQITKINATLKKNKLPFWMPTRIGSPVEVLGPASLNCPDYETAMKIANREVELDGGNGYVYYTRALVQHKFDHDKEALADANKALSLTAQEYSFIILKARLEVMLKQFDEAMDDVHKAMKIDRKDHAEAYDIAGCCQLAKAKKTAAKEFFDKALANDAEYGAAYYHRAITNQLMGNKLKADQDLVRAQNCNYLPDKWDEEFKRSPQSVNHHPH